MSIVVAEEGNRRVGGMTGAELRQCILDIQNWFSRTKCERNMNGPASSADFQRLQKSLDMEITDDLKSLLGEINGGIYFMEKELLSTNKIIDIVSMVGGNKIWRESYIPFCGDENSMLMIDSRDEGIYEWDSDDGKGDKIADNLCAFLEGYRNNLLSGQFDFLEEIGVIEKVSKMKSKK
eukprot:gene6778-9284_t